MEGHLPCVKFLVSEGPSPTHILGARNDNGETPKMLSQQFYKDNVVEYITNIEWERDHPEESESKGFCCLCYQPCLVRYCFKRRGWGERVGYVLSMSIGGGMRGRDTSYRGLSKPVLVWWRGAGRGVSTLTKWPTPPPRWKGWGLWSVLPRNVNTTLSCLEIYYTITLVSQWNESNTLHWIYVKVAMDKRWAEVLMNKA